MPAGFKEKHNKQTATIDDPKSFYTKDEYLKLYDQVRTGTFKALDSMKETDFDKPGPEKLRNFCPTIGSCLRVASESLVDARRSMGYRPP